MRFMRSLLIRVFNKNYSHTKDVTSSIIFFACPKKTMQKKGHNHAPWYRQAGLSSRHNFRRRVNKLAPAGRVSDMSTLDSVQNYCTRLRCNGFKTIKPQWVLSVLDIEPAIVLLGKWLQYFVKCSEPNFGWRNEE